MKITRTEDGISFQDEHESGVVSMIQAETADPLLYRRWLDACAKQVRADPHTVRQAVEHLCARYDAEPLPPEDSSLLHFQCGVILGHFPHKLRHRPEAVSMSMSDEEFARWHRDTRAQWEEAMSIPAQQLGLAVYGYRLGWTERNRALFERDEQWAGPPFPTQEEPCCTILLEAATGSISGSGPGCDALCQELVVYLGVTQEDIQARSHRFAGYVQALCQRGGLPGSERFCDGQQP